MSKRHSITAEADHILRDFKIMSPDQFSSLYNVELSETGSVTDLTYEKSFKTLGEWAVFTARLEQYEDSTFEPIHHGVRTDE